LSSDLAAGKVAVGGETANRVHVDLEQLRELLRGQHLGDRLVGREELGTSDRPVLVDERSGDQLLLRTAELVGGAIEPPRQVCGDADEERSERLRRREPDRTFGAHDIR
jgi:hypothetical protein